MIREPLTTRSLAENVEQNAATAGTRMNDPIAASVDGDVIDRGAFVGEEQQIARTERADARGHQATSRRDFGGGARQPDSLLAEDILHEGQRIEAVRRTGAATSIRRVEQPLG